jgi:hypothetical protein
VKLYTLTDVIQSFDEEIADRALAFGWHHHDENNEPFWTEEELDRILGLIEIEKRDEEDDRQ